jgi:hypothetical protein
MTARACCSVSGCAAELEQVPPANAAITAKTGAIFAIRQRSPTDGIADPRADRQIEVSAVRIEGVCVFHVQFVATLNEKDDKGARSADYGEVPTHVAESGAKRQNRASVQIAFKPIRCSLLVR